MREVFLLFKKTPHNVDLNLEVSPWFHEYIRINSIFDTGFADMFFNYTTVIIYIYVFIQKY